MISETEFIKATDATLAAIGGAIDAAADAADADADWTLNDGILEIDCGAGGKLIVNRHVVNREIWVAARSGGHHFAAVQGRWRDTRTGEDLAALLAKVAREQAGIDVALPALVAPAG